MNITKSLILETYGSRLCAAWQTIHSPRSTHASFVAFCHVVGPSQRLGPYARENDIGLEDTLVTTAASELGMPRSQRTMMRIKVSLDLRKHCTSGSHSPRTSAVSTCNSFSCPAPGLSLSVPLRRTQAPLVSLQKASAFECVFWICE